MSLEAIFHKGREAMTRFVELTQESGSKITVNVEQIVTFAPLGGDPLRGTAIAFGFSTGDKMAARTVRVVEPYIEVSKLFARK